MQAAGREQEIAPGARIGQATHGGRHEVHPIDRLRSQEYDLLANLLGRAPTRAVLETLAALKGDTTALGTAHIALAQAAAKADADVISREFFDLFIGVGRGEFLPYASYYLTGFLNGRPLARVRDDFSALGIERSEALREPEDHIAVLLETMAGLASGRFEIDEAGERRFFQRHIEPWAGRFFADLEAASAGTFYPAVGALGRIYVEIESEAFRFDR